MLIQKLKLLSKADVCTVGLFLAGFLFAVTDLKLLHFIGLCLKAMFSSQFSFIIAYFVIIAIMFFVTKIIIKNIDLFRISKEVLLKKEFFLLLSSFLRVICVGYTIGFIVTVLNAFVIETFARIVI
jgi:hypothetical protein